MIAVFGSGVSSRFFNLGCKKAVTFTCKLENNFYASLPLNSGLSKYWHQGMMAPDPKVLNSLNIPEEVINEFNLSIGLDKNFHRNNLKMSILNFDRNFWSQNAIDIGEIVRVDKKGSSFIVITKDNTYTFSKIVLALSTIGNLSFLSRCSFIDQNILNNTFVNDHLMSLSEPFRLNHKISDDWIESRNGIHQFRTSFLGSRLYLSKYVNLLTLPYFGKIIYGFLSPLYLFDIFLKKIFGPRFIYKFNLLTPIKPLYNFIDNEIVNNVDVGVRAFHTIGSSTYSYFSKIDNILLLSGNFLPLDFKYFPTYTIALYSFYQGKLHV